MSEDTERCCAACFKAYDACTRGSADLYEAHGYRIGAVFPVRAKRAGFGFVWIGGSGCCFFFSERGRG